VLVLTNLDSEESGEWLARHVPEVAEFTVLGATELGECLDRRPELRAVLPSVLGLRDLDPLIASDARDRSTLEIGPAQELARVFWSTRAYERARAVLGRHRFVVLTGPPEMGKTAIARMLALSQLTDGWDAHECTSPDQVWQLFDRERKQVFVADDAFGSTEYRADAADRWAHELGPMLAALDDRHWLIWTSRPAPLKAGLRRVQRGRGAEHFPATSEVLVDASELDLAEKTLILFRHAKNHGLDEEARRLLRSAGVSIVEHPHFTPERIRRLVAERLDALPEIGVGGGVQYLIRMVEDELATPTEAMRNSFRALEDEYRQLLVAMLDAPAGLIDERDLVATVRRHHSGGLRRPPAELIDRLTDHFLRVTPLGIGWVHPSWRDLVIDELAHDAAPRRRFLSSCGIYGLMLALSSQGGAVGERAFPLLIADCDWDTLADRIAQLLAELEDRDMARLLVALSDALNAALDLPQHVEAVSLTEYVLGAARRCWDKRARPLPVYLLEAWYGANALLPERQKPPLIGRTWAELHPSWSFSGGVTGHELQVLEEWLALAEVLSIHDSVVLRRVGFYERDQQLLAHLAVELGDVNDPDLTAQAENLLRRIRELSSTYRDLARTTLTRLRERPADERWWVPHDIEVPPSNEPVTQPRIGFSRDDVDRVLADL
jgi:hypothetical protein